MKIALALLLFTAVLPLHAQTTSKTASVTKQKDPLAVHQAAIVIDTHADTTQRMLDEGYDLTEPLKGGYVNFESARQGNLGAEFFSIWVDPVAYPNGHEARRTLEVIDAVNVHFLADYHRVSPDVVWTERSRGRSYVVVAHDFDAKSHGKGHEKDFDDDDRGHGDGHGKGKDNGHGR